MNQQAMSSVDELRICAGRRVVDVHALDLDGRACRPSVVDVDVRLAEDHEQVAGAGVLQQRSSGPISRSGFIRTGRTVSLP